VGVPSAVRPTTNRTQRGTNEDVDAFYTLIRCEAFEHARDELGLVIGSFRLCELVTRMLESPGNWDAWRRFVEAVMRSKEEAERGRQSLQGIAPLWRWGEREGDKGPPLNFFVASFCKGRSERHCSATPLRTTSKRALAQSCTYYICKGWRVRVLSGHPL